MWAGRTGFLTQLCGACVVLAKEETPFCLNLTESGCNRVIVRRASYSSNPIRMVCVPLQYVRADVVAKWANATANHPIEVLRSAYRLHYELCEVRLHTNEPTGFWARNGILKYARPKDRDTKAYAQFHEPVIW